MDTKAAVKNRILELCNERNISLNYLAHLSAISPSTIKNIMYDVSKNPGIVTIKLLCDGLDISLYDFFNTETFKNLEQEIR